MAAASSAEPYGAWAYLAVFALMTLTFAGVPAIGAALGAEVGPAAYGAAGNYPDVLRSPVTAGQSTPV